MQDQKRASETPLFSFWLDHMGALIQWSAQKPGNTLKYMPLLLKIQLFLLGGKDLPGPMWQWKLGEHQTEE